MLASQAGKALGRLVRSASAVTLPTRQKHIDVWPSCTTPSWTIPTDESPEVFDKRFLDFFNRADLDGWQLRRGMAELNYYDVIPEPEICVAVFKACRRLNDFALTVRFQETLKEKCCGWDKTTYPWLLQECKSTMDELGIPTLEQIGYDKPELFMPYEDYWDWEHYPEAKNIPNYNMDHSESLLYRQKHHLH